MTQDNKALLIDTLWKMDHMLSMMTNGLSEMFNFVTFTEDKPEDIESRENLSKILQVAEQLRSAVQQEGNKLNGNE